MSIPAETIELIRTWASRGIDLNGIQKNLAEAGIQMRFMDLRFLMLDHNIEIAAPAAEEVNTAPAADAPTSPAPAAEAPPVSVTLDDIQIPGTMISGKATFASGIRGAWIFDQSGRFAWSDLSAQPQPEEMRAFEQALNRLLSQGA